MINKILQKNNKDRERGVAVLFAVLVSVLLVSIGATIISIALRQTILSSTGRESQYAFYAANTAMECALYWDLNPPLPEDPAGPQEYVFPVETGLNQTRASGSFTCSGDDFTGDWDTSTEDSTTIEFIINSSISGVDHQYCATVTVEKLYNSGLTTTTIKAKGYNSPTCGFTSSRTVERGLELSYTS